MCAKQNEEGCVTVTWEIRNFSLLLEADEAKPLLTPYWKVEHTEGNADWWWLQAWHSASNIYFYSYSSKGYIPSIKRKLTLVSSGGEVPLEQLLNHSSKIQKSAFLGQNKQSLLTNDTLTLRCRMWNKTIRNRELSIRSDLHKVNYLWNIDIKRFVINDFFNSYIEQNNFLLCVSLKKKIINDTTHVVRFEGHCEESFISIVDCNMCFKDGQKHKFTIDSCAICECNVKLCTENYTDVFIDLQAVVARHNRVPAESKIPDETTQSSGALCDDFLLLFKDKLFCDATLTAEGYSFPAHRVVLAARSPVFRAKFERRETSEGRSGVVAIDDVDGATLERMLVFLYGGTLGEVDWDEASALYYAADKYDVRALKQKCAEILKGGLTADNVCDALVLADRHSDQDLMTRVVDFLFEHQDVMSSTSWEELEDSQGRLTSKILRKVLFKKERNC